MWSLLWIEHVYLSGRYMAIDNKKICAMMMRLDYVLKNILIIVGLVVNKIGKACVII